MKNTFFILVLAAATVFVSCRKEGPVGPEGPMGKVGLSGLDGKDGEDGKDGKDGQDFSMVCKQCHSSNTAIYAAQLQYEHSQHGSGENAGYGNRTDCSGCHNNEGFQEYLATGKANVAANPTPISCYTCHFVHTNYDSTDLGLRTVAPVKLMADNSLTVDLGKANLCFTCHQSRAHGVATLTATSTDAVSITSSRFGPHHGPQGNMFAGMGKSAAFEITGSSTYSNSMHTSMVSGSCISCHMGSAVNGPTGGGHSMNIYYDSHGVETLNSANCTMCHSSATTLANILKGTQTEISTLLTSLESELVNRGYYDTVTDLFKASSTKPLVVTADEARTMYNFKFVQEDLSLGVHNYAYAKALLENSIEYLQNNKKKKK